MSTDHNCKLFLRPLPYLDFKWLRADLICNLINVECTAILWNNLIQECELVSSPSHSVVNNNGNLSYLGDDGKHYCGAVKLNCLCCLGYCGPLSGCNCTSCHFLDSDSVIKKTLNTNQTISNEKTSDLILDSWVWDTVPNKEQKEKCMNALVKEQHDLALKASGNSLFSIHLRHQLYIYERYFVALARCKERSNFIAYQNTLEKQHIHFENQIYFNYSNKLECQKFTKDNDGAIGLARVGTRAALNFSFAFLWRAWRSGEDTEMCSELLSEALESLQELPEASLFDLTQNSPLWIEVLERSIKFLRQVVCDGVIGDRCIVPRKDRHIALCLLLELGSQKGTLSSSLDAVVLLLKIWDREKECDDNRNIPYNSGVAPLLRILKRYEKIDHCAVNLPNNEVQNLMTATATESFLRFLTLPDLETANVDLKQASVIIMAHLDRLAKPHMPPIELISPKISQSPIEQQQDQQIFGLGWLTLNSENYGFNSEPFIGTLNFKTFALNYSASIFEFKFKIKQVVFSDDAVLFLSIENKIYVWKINMQDKDPTLLNEFRDVPIIKVAAHIEGKHYLALDLNGHIYSWGSGENGRLGHGDTNTKEIPAKILYFKDKQITNIFCGCAHSAAISKTGELYTWGRGSFDRLGHGNSDDKLIPHMVHALHEFQIMYVAFGSGDAHSLCVTTDGIVYAWGDGDFGKLGNGSCTGSQTPTRIECLPKIKKIFAGSQFSIALSNEGKIYSWGKDFGGCLGHGLTSFSSHGPSEILHTPKQILALDNKIIVDVAVGAGHCLALSNTGEVFGWGRNEYQQICPQSISEETIIHLPILATHQSIRMSGISCGSAQSILWYDTSVIGFAHRLPFVIDLCEQTFRLLDQLLGKVCVEELHQTPSQESECIAVACLNILRLQIHSLIANNYPMQSVGLSEGSKLLSNIKSKLLKLAGGSCILKTIQEAAQSTLQVGWCILLPTVSERAQTLATLVPSELGISSSGHRFMIDLLVVSLMAGEGLETALNQALYSRNNDSINNGNSLPLLHLIKQLLRNNSALTQARLTQLLVPSNYFKIHGDDNYTISSKKNSPSLDLLHNFQRLLLSYVHQIKNDEISDGEILLSEYLENIVSFSTISLQRAHEIAVQGRDGIIDIMKSDISDTLLYELLIGLVLLNRDKPNILSTFEWKKLFFPLLQAFDNLNRIMCDIEMRDSDDMGWPGIVCRGSNKVPLMIEESQLIRKHDLDNHIVDGGHWIIVNGYVCDIQDYKHENTSVNQIIEYGIGKDITSELNATGDFSVVEYIAKKFKIGRYGTYYTDEKNLSHQSKIVTHFNSERTLAYLLGSRACILQCGPILQAAEIQCKNLLTSQILRGGLQVLQPTNPFDEEKGEARSTASTAGNTPTEPSNKVSISKYSQQSVQRPYNLLSKKIESFLNGLGEARLNDPLVSAWIIVCERFAKENNFIWHQDFNPDHPVQELDRLLTAVLIRHQSLGPLVMSVIDHQLGGCNEKPPKKIAEIIRLVHQTKWTIIRNRQQLNRSYKEVCAPMLERLRFLLFEVRPAISLEQSALNKIFLLHKQTRFKRLVKKIIVGIRLEKKKTCVKPEDIVNVTIQSFGNKKIQENMSQDVVIDNLNSLRDATVDNLSSTNTMHKMKNYSNENVAEVEDNDYINDKNSLKSTVDIHLSDKVSEQFFNDDLFKVGEQSVHQCKNDTSTIKTQIVSFILQEICDVETLRRAMFCQVQRYKTRRQGIEMFNDLLQINGLLDAVQYNIFSGYLGLHLNRSKIIVKHILDELNMITAFQKAKLILCQSKIIDWSVLELQKLVNQEQIPSEQKFRDGKDTSNLGTYVFLKKLPRARFLLSLFGILAKLYGPNELSLIINSGTIGMILGLLRQTGVDFTSVIKGNELSVAYQDTVLKQTSCKINLSGSDIAKLMKIGTRVCRGSDWKWGDQDGNPPGEGRIISEVGEDGWVRVEWDTGGMNSYRMGKEKQYDLRLAESVSNIMSPDVESEKDFYIFTMQLTGESHPKTFLRYCCIKMIKSISVGLGQHGDLMEKNSVLALTSMYRTVLQAKTVDIANLCGLKGWTTLGFLRAIAGSSKILSKYLTSPNWIDLYMNILTMPISCEQDIFIKIHCLRLLQTILIYWDEENSLRCWNLVKQMFLILGNTCFYCPNDLSLIHSTINGKSRNILTCSHSSTISEEIITLLRKLHSVPLWTPVINSFISQKLCVAAEIFGGEVYDIDMNKLEFEKVGVMGVLNTIGGCDSRPRLGLKITNEGRPATICGFSQKGKCLISNEQEYPFDIVSDFKKISLNTVSECADHIGFNLPKLPLNEILLNAFAVLIYGSKERKHSICSTINVVWLRLQQIQLSVLNANCVLYRHQTPLRRILKQKCPRFNASSSEESLSDFQLNCQSKISFISSSDTNQKTSQIDINPNLEEQTNVESPFYETELLIQSILIRATQPSPLKACYSYQELAIAALNISQMLSSFVHAENNTSILNFGSLLSQPWQSTLLRDLPVCNEELQIRSNKNNNIYRSSINYNRNSTSHTPLVLQIMEIGFSKKSVELAIKKISLIDTNQLSPEHIVQWILEHPDLCPPLPSTSGLQSLHNNSDDSNSERAFVVCKNAKQNEMITTGNKFKINNDGQSDSESTADSDTVEECSIQNQYFQKSKYATNKDFQIADQYAMYIRGIVLPGMIVKCCRNFEEIKIGDIGTVLKVDTEGLHDLNVQVDWQIHGSPFWVCFIHIELLESPKEEANGKNIVIGSQVRIKSQITTPRYKWGLVRPGSVGNVTSISGRDCTVNFKQQENWQGCLEEMELVCQQNTCGTNACFNFVGTNNTDIIEDSLRCVRTLTVSSNENSAKHLLDKTTNYWQSSSNNQGGRHWIRLEMHDNILIQNLTLIVDPSDCSHMPSLITIKVGNNLAELKEYSCLSVKPTDVNVSLLNDMQQYYQWFEIVIKQCRNNGVQCRIHGINITGQRKQSDLDIVLMKADFLASEYDTMCEPLSCPYTEDKLQTETICSVMVWGLNDKEQLGGLKGSKVKVPTISQTLSRLRPMHISGGSKSLFIVSQDGKVYACGEGTNGRLGLGHNCNVSMPKQIPVIHQYVVKKVAVHSGGKHALALTLDGKVFSWGEGEDGKLGHGNRLTLDKPKQIEVLRSKKIRDIACGSSHSAAITSSGELYTWGLGEYGRLGHGDNITQLKPKLVISLSGMRVIQVACGSRDAQTLALTEKGTVYSWGDGDFGKLGRGGSEGSSIPHEVERLTGICITQIECGAQFSLALTKNGEVWTWGKGDYYRLGHGTDQHVRKPAPIQGLRGKKVIHVAVGALHCLAVTDCGKVYAWGDNDHGQQGSGSIIVNKKPAVVIGLDSVFVNRVACGSSHSVAWGLPQSSFDDEKKIPVPFGTTKDSLGGSGLGIYDSELQTGPATKALSKSSLTEKLFSLQTYGAQQTALNYVLNAMSILQARQILVSALVSHSQISYSEKHQDDTDSQEVWKETNKYTNSSIGLISNNDIISQGGGEAPADATDPAVRELELETLTQPGLKSTFHSLTGSLSLSESLSSNPPHRHSKMSGSAMSVMAATMTHHEEIISESTLRGLDDFTSLFGEHEAKSLVELLKLSVAGRSGSQLTSRTISDTLITLGTTSSLIGAMLLETCITELEDLYTSRDCLGKMPKPILQESSHPYIDDITLVGHVKIPGADGLRLEFDSQCSTEKRNDPLILMDGSGRVIATRSGREFTQWAPEVRIQGEEMKWKFTSDSSVNGWGWRFWVHAIMPSTFLQEQGSERAILCQPSMPLVMALLDSRLEINNQIVLLRLLSALSDCSQLNSLPTIQRIWSLKKLHTIMMTKYAPKPLDASLNAIIMPLIPELLRQYDYEEPQVRGGVHLMYSDYFKTIAAFACDMLLDSVLPVGEMHKWSWFRRYCSAIRVAQALIHRTELPCSFKIEVRKKLSEMMPVNLPSNLNIHTTSSVMMNSTISMSSSITSNTTPPIPLLSQINESSLNLKLDNVNQCIDSVSCSSLHENHDFKTVGVNNFLHEDHHLFKKEHDSQLLQWLNQRPEDWSLSWGGASTIYGWGHNHRGQLGGLEGSRIKLPTPCEALSLLRPVQLAGGEQTLYAVTPDGKLFATGYGAGGRLGVGGTDSVTSPSLIESLQHVFVKKVAVNSGGKHCLALTTDGEVYAWGEGEDGKVGHGNRISYDRPKLIEALSGIEIIDIACGSAHSACITSSGHVLTWGKGRYGRLGHGDSEDQLRPKLVEALLGYRAVDIACGSGDAQTLCITDDDNVWSWGDGDYGKLGRGGSDGCKVPMKIESLSGLGVVKVECGSQFSVALTRSGSIYTWGKGDYHRLGHGTVDHVRRPKKVAALQSKKVISIATGSLHCVACSDTGEVYTWGDNDEGQLGDGTVSAIQRPRLVSALQGKHIVKVTCGSAHTLALSTSQLTKENRQPPNPPLEFDLVRDLPPETLHARLVLLHHFSELICPCLVMLPIFGDISLGSLKDILVYSIKEAAFRKVIQTTMVRDKQHGPVIELNRIQVKRFRNKSSSGLAGIDGMKSVFGQMVQKLPLLTQEALSLPHRIWKVKFVGESVDDCGGGYSESIAEMCDELQNGSVPLLISTPNGRGEAGANRDCFLLDPTLNSVLQMNMFRFLGVLMGVAIRTGSPLSLNLAEPVWRQLTGENLSPADLTEVDRDYIAGLLYVRDMEDDVKVFKTLELPFSTSSAKGHEVSLSTRFYHITPQNRQEYVRLALNYRLHEFDEQVKAVRDGMSKVIPLPLLSLFSASELQAMVCGSPDIPLGLLKSVANYKGVDSSSSLVNWFWEVMEEFSNQERSLFLRFVWGRTRLPRTIADFRGRDFVLQVLDKYNPADHFLPESYTCFFLLKMPRYSCKLVLSEKLKYAIHFCKSIDTDDYARVAMGNPTEATESEDNSDFESVASHDD